MREAFEKLPEIARHIHKFVYQDDLNCYRNKIKSSDIHLVTWVNGAWYAFQEQQAKAQMARDEKTYAINRWTAVCKERDDLKAQLECCRKENAVLLGKVGEGEKRIRRASQLMDRAAEDGTESVDIGSLYDALIKGSDLDESLRGAND